MGLRVQPAGTTNALHHTCRDARANVAPSHRRAATVRHDQRADDEAGSGRSEEGDHFRDLSGLGDPAKCMEVAVPGQRRAAVRNDALQDLGRHHSRVPPR